MKLDDKGNIIIGTTAILIVFLLLMCVFITASLHYIKNENIESEVNDNFKYIIDDYSRNVEVFGRESIDEAAHTVSHGWRLFSSENEIKKNLNNHLNEKNIEYEEKYDAKLSSEVLSVESTDSPWKVLVKVRLNGEKNNERFSNIIASNVSIEGLLDPLPVAKLSAFSGLIVLNNKYHYHLILMLYMKTHLMECPESYMFATSPYTIQRCPYDPYIHHGDPGVLDDCLKQGYYHESADGSCYLCRLEGKGKCPHYGMEVFIQTHTPLLNDSTSCSDHVVFNDHYPGKKVNPLDVNSLILDSAHQKKYGLV